MISQPHDDQYELQRGVYDAIHAGIKDHSKEVARLLKRVRGAIGHEPASWLDVGCGTGLHLQALHAVGVPRLLGADNSPAQIEAARARLAGTEVELQVADMRSMELPCPEGGFQVVSCLFSCVGHLHQDADYLEALRRMAAHLHPKGVVLLEPWIASEDFVPGRVEVDVVENQEGKIVRITKHTREDGFAELEFRFIVSRPGRPQIDDWIVPMRLRLRDLDTQRAMFEQVFSSVEFHSTGSGSRGIFLARKPRFEPLV